MRRPLVAAVLAFLGLAAPRADRKSEKRRFFYLAALVSFCAIAFGGARTAMSQTAEVLAGDFQRPIHIGNYDAVLEPLPVADGVHEVTLLVRAEPAGGELLWEQSYPTIPIRNGIIEAQFVGPPDDLDISGAWLDVLVDGQAVGRSAVMLASEKAAVELGDKYVRFMNTYGDYFGGQIYYTGPLSSMLRFTNYDGEGIDMSVGDGSAAWNVLQVEAPSGRLYLFGGSNATLADGSGILEIGFEDEPNLVLDGNEIQARNNGAASTLFLQHQGGDIWFNAAPIHTSDRRKKREIRDLDLGLNEILHLRPVSFEWKDYEGPRRPGLVAQEVRDVIEEIVVEDEEGTLGLAYGSLIPVLVRAIHEQQAEIEQLRADLEALRVQVSGG